MTNKNNIWFKGMYIVNSAWKYVGEDYMGKDIFNTEDGLCAECYTVFRFMHLDSSEHYVPEKVRGGVKHMAKLNRNDIAKRLVLREGLRKVQNIGDAKEFLREYNECLTLREVMEIWLAYNKS